MDLRPHVQLQQLTATKGPLANKAAQEHRAHKKSAKVCTLF